MNRAERGAVGLAKGERDGLDTHPSYRVLHRYTRHKHWVIFTFKVLQRHKHWAKLRSDF
jgi:hypothetical protein